MDDGDFVVNDVSHHARMRVKERGLPLESLSGHAPGVKTVIAPSGKVVTVMSTVEKPRFLRGIKNQKLFRDDAQFGAAVSVASTHSVDATDLVPYVVGKCGATIKRVCERHGVRVTVHGSTLRIEGDASAAAAAEFESIIDRKRRALRWDGAAVVDVTGGFAVGRAGRVIGNIFFNVGLVGRGSDHVHGRGRDSV